MKEPKPIYDVIAADGLSPRVYPNATLLTFSGYDQCSRDMRCFVTLKLWNDGRHEVDVTPIPE